MHSKQANMIFPHSLSFTQLHITLYITQKTLMYITSKSSHKIIGLDQL
jgi:hypothetical protein